MEKEALGASREYEQVHPMPTTIRNSMQANHSTTALLSTTAQPVKEGEEQKEPVARIGAAGFLTITYSCFKCLDFWGKCDIIKHTKEFTDMDEADTRGYQRDYEEVRFEKTGCSADV